LPVDVISCCLFRVLIGHYLLKYHKCKVIIIRWCVDKKMALLVLRSVGLCSDSYRDAAGFF